jgi:hypothetical protein
VATTITKISVRTTNRTVSATSLGVFWRDAPSTRWIIRSRKVWPGSAVTRTIRKSETSAVPAVTDENTSVPGSLRTGADSPVIADSST